MKVLLTGASGVIGSATAGALHDAGHELRLTDQNVRKGLPGRMEVVSLLDREACYRLCEGMDAIVHLGNLANAGRGNPQAVFTTNATININVFQAAQECGVQEIIFASSVQACFGTHPSTDGFRRGPDYLPIDSDHPTRAGNTYGLSKIVGEEQLRFYHEGGQFRALTALRFPYIESRGASRQAIASYRTYGEWEAFTWLRVGDAASLMVAILRAQLSGFRIYLPAAHAPVNDRPVPELIQEYYKHVPLKKPIEEMDSLVDNSRITAETGWTPSC